MNDIDIARTASPLPIAEIGRRLGVGEEALELYGRWKAKIHVGRLPRHAHGESRNGKLILVTAISPTPAGEGKTTVTVGLGDALSRLGHKTVIALREPSLGPVFGMKGGAAGGGRAQVLPMEDLNLHFTGDFHAITTANNLLAAMVDNHLQQGNALDIDPRRVVWRRCLDMNDRQLRHVVTGMGGTANGVPEESGFDITAASEVMAVFCLAEDLGDLKTRLGRMIVGYTKAGGVVTAADLRAEGAMTALLRDAFMPNLVQSLEHTPVLIHGGPFANIAHGCNSLQATRLALRLGDYTVTEAGFGADLGAEKFLDIKCRVGQLRPDACVTVATIRALKRHGGADLKSLTAENLGALERGLPNLLRHADNLRSVYGLPTAVAINRFSTDTDGEIELLSALLRQHGLPFALCDVWAGGGAGGEDLGRLVVKLCEEPSHFRHSYNDGDSLTDKLNAVVQKVYRGRRADITAGAKKQAAQLQKQGYGHLPVCIAKTQYSFSDDPKALGAPDNFDITVRALRVSAGAGFIVALTGDIMSMPGLPKTPSAEQIDVDGEGNIVGIF